MSQFYFLPKIVNYDIEKNIFFMSEVVINKGEFSIQVALLAKEVPFYANRFKEKLSYRSFNSEEYLDENGHLRLDKGDNLISLKDMTAFWYPNQEPLYHNLLKNYYKTVKNNGTGDVKAISSDDPNSSIGKDRKMHPMRHLDIQQLAKMLLSRKTLIFTGAGISISQGLPNLDQLVDLIRQIFFPEEELIQEILSGITSRRIEKIQAYNQLIFNKSPSRSHWIISDICKTYGISLVTGNFDGLHEKTGIDSVFQNNEEVVIHDLGQYEMLITIGLGDEGIGRVADVFRQRSANATIVAINTIMPNYLMEHDYFIQGHSDDILNQLMINIQKMSKLT